MTAIPTCFPAQVLAWSEALTVRGVAETIAYAWAPAERAAVIGLGQVPEQELRLETLARDGVNILRRSSGGGAVILAPGMLCFGVIAPPEAVSPKINIRAAFRALTEPVIEACSEIGISAAVTGISDLAAAAGSDRFAPLVLARPGAAMPTKDVLARPGAAMPTKNVAAGASPALAPNPDRLLFKIAGCAQLRKRRGVLVHGSLLVDADISLFDKYLRFPPTAPEYRQERGHQDFCRTLTALRGKAVTVAEMYAGLEKKCAARGWSWCWPPAVLDGEAQALYEIKYDHEGWNLRRERRQLVPGRRPSESNGPSRG